MKKVLQSRRPIIFPFVFVCAFILIYNLFTIKSSAYVITSMVDDDLSLVNIEKNLHENKKYVTLTFDDGPHPQYTEKVLDVLEEKNVPATFFVVGFRAEAHPDTILRIKKLNCEIGNHTYEHKNLRRISTADALNEMKKCSDIIYEITGEYPKVYRPPFGEIGLQLEKKIDMTKILWTIDSSDWRIKNEKSRVVNNVVPKVNNNSIILLHDFYKATVDALPEIIDRLQADGFEFITISELLKIDSSAGSTFGVD